MRYKRATAVLLASVAVGGAVGWALLFLTGPSGIMIGWTVLLSVVVVAGGYVSPKSVRQSRVWQAWALLSGLGMLVDTYALIVQTRFWLSFGLLHPWFVVLSLGYAFTALHRRQDARLPTASRYVFGTAALLSVGGLVSVTALSSAITTIVLLLAVLTAVPSVVVGIRFYRMG